MKANNHIKVTQTIIEIFKTNASNRQLANQIVSDINQLYPDYRINFDLEDCDKVLRVEGKANIEIWGVLGYGRTNDI